MIITQLSMDGFGVFNDVTITDLPAGLILFLGDNEVGKSTVHGFVHTVLFGYPKSRSGEKYYPPLNGGSAGGRLQLVTDTRGLVTVARTEGPKGGKVNLTFEDGETGSGSALEKILGGTNRTMFRNLYGFSLTELQSIETLTSEEVRDVIYGASLGTGLRTLTEARKRLKNRMEDLFKFRGSTPEMNVRLKDLEETATQLKEAKEYLEDYERAGEQIRTCTTEIKNISDELDDARKRRFRVDALKKVWEDWIGLKQAEAGIADLELKVEDFPEDGLANLEKLKQEIKRQQIELQEVEEERKNKSKDLEDRSFDEKLLEQSAEIEGLIQGLETFEKNVASIPASEDRVRECQNNVAAVLPELGTGWTEQRAIALDRSAHVKEEIAEHKKNLVQREENSTNLSAKLDSRVTAFEESRDEQKQAGERVEELEDAGLDVDRATLDRLRDGRKQFTSVLTDLPRRETERQEASEELIRTLADIDPGWTMQNFEEMDTSLSARKKIEQFEKKFRETETEVRSAKERINIAEDVVEKKRRARDEKENLLVALGGMNDKTSDLEVRRRDIREFRQQVRDREEVEGHLAVAKQQQEMIATGHGPDHVPDAGRFLGICALIVAVVGVLLYMTFSSMDQAMYANASVIGGGLIAVALLHASKAQSRPPNRNGHSGFNPAGTAERIEKLKGQLAEMNATINECEKQLGLSEALDLAAVDRLADENEEQLRLARDRDDRIVDLKQSEEDRNAAKDALAMALKKEADTVKEWEEHARSLSLSADTSPFYAGLIFEKVEKARGEKRVVGGLGLRIDEMNSCRTDYLEEMAKVPRLEKVLEGKADVILTELSKFLAEIGQQEERRAKLERAREALGEAEKRTSAADDKRVQVEADLNEAQKAQRIIKDVWKQWLKDHDMDLGWSPITASHALDRVIRLVEIVGDRTSAENEVARADAEVKGYRQRVSNVFAALDRTAPEEQEIPVEIRRLNVDRVKHENLRTGHDQLSDEISGIDSRCSTSRKKLERTKDEHGKLIVAGSVKDEDEFRCRGKLHGDLMRYKAEIATHESAILKVLGTTNLDDDRAELAVQSLDRLTSEEDQLNETVAELEDVRDKAREEKGASEKIRKDLDSDNRVAALRAKEEGLKEELEVMAHDWARHAVAEHLLDTARERHAEANQPRVIQEASKYFSKITSGVTGSQLLWVYSRLQNGEFSFSIRNQLREPISNIYCLIVFRDENSLPIDSKVIRYQGVVPAGLAKRVPDKVDEAVQTLTTRVGSKIPIHGRVEFRILDFKVEE